MINVLLCDIDEAWIKSFLTKLPTNINVAEPVNETKSDLVVDMPNHDTGFNEDKSLLTRSRVGTSRSKL